MPTYLYSCAHLECIKEFEEYHSISFKLETCPYCQEAGRGEQPVSRLINQGGSGKGIMVKSGQEIQDSFASDVARMKKEVYGNEGKLANIIGESKYNTNELARTKR